MAMFSAKIKGLDEAIMKFSKLDMKVGNAVRDVVNKSAREIRKGAIRYVPIDSGALKKSIKIRWAKDRLSADVDATLWRAHFTEFGTIDTPPVPFMYPAWLDEKDNYLSNIKKAVKGECR